MLTIKLQVITVVTIIILNLLIVECWFERSNYRVDLQSNVVFPLKSLPYQRGTSTRVLFVGPRNNTLSLICNINFSKGCRRNSYFGREITRRGRCCDDYFYVGFNRDPNIRGAERFCGKKTIRKNTRRTTGRPVLVVATSATRRGRYGKYKCYITSRGSSTAPVDPTEEAPTEDAPTEEAPTPDAPTPDAPIQDTPTQELVPINTTPP